MKNLAIISVIMFFMANVTVTAKENETNSNRRPAIPNKEQMEAFNAIKSVSDTIFIANFTLSNNKVVVKKLNGYKLNKEQSAKVSEQANKKLNK